MPEGLAEYLHDNFAKLDRIFTILFEMFKTKKDVFDWLGRPHPDLGDRRPINVIMFDREMDAVLTILENAIAGIPN